MQLTYDALKAEFKRVLLARKLREDTAEAVATLFADTTLSGIYSHGVNRFPRFIYQLDQGISTPKPSRKKCCRWAR